MKDTICALATAPGRGAIAIVRVSGPDSLFLYRKITKSSSLPKPRVFTLKNFYDTDGEVIDKGLVVFFKSPNSYTGEDMLEFHVHGGNIVSSLLIKTLILHGARMAEPGEFTKRAFLNGKMDLLQAEAVDEIISAKTELQYRKALSKLKGKLSRELEPVLELIKRILMEIEARIEFEDDVGPLDRNKVKTYFEELEGKINDIINRAKGGKFIQNGIKVVIYGKTNVGKSTLFNKILGEERAIVTPYAGTTRDVVHEEVDIAGIPVRFIDTAGIRDAKDPVEKIGIERTRNALKEADIIIYVREPGDERHSLNVDKPIIYVLNKIDLLGESSKDELYDAEVPVSALTGEGMDKLIDRLQKEIKERFYRENAVILKARELAILEDVKKEVGDAKRLLEERIDEIELVSFHLNEAYRKHRELLGFGELPEEVLNSIFENFCIGK